LRDRERFLFEVHMSTEQKPKKCCCVHIYHTYFSRLFPTCVPSRQHSSISVVAMMAAVRHPKCLQLRRSQTHLKKMYFFSRQNGFLGQAGANGHKDDGGLTHIHKSALMCIHENTFKLFCSRDRGGCATNRRKTTSARAVKMAIRKTAKRALA